MNNATKKFTVTAILDQESGLITAFFDDLPGLVVQGNSHDNVKAKLQDLLKLYIKKLQSIGNDFEITTKSMA